MSQCLLLAQSRHRTVEFQCPLLGVKQKLVGAAAMSAFDPKRTWTAQDCCRANLPLNPISPVANPCCNYIVAGVIGVVLSLGGGNATTRFY